MNKIIKLMTYNVHRCIGPDQQLSVERTAKVIAKENPDIVGIQELDVGTLRSQSLDQAEQLAALLKMKFHFSPTLEIDEGKYGIAILSKYHMNEVLSGSLPLLRRKKTLEARGALWVEVDVEGTLFNVVNTHLSLHFKERRLQVKELLSQKWLGKLNPIEKTVLMGDFNCGPWSYTGLQLAGKFDNVSQQTLLPWCATKTLFGRWPVLRIDHIFISEDMKVKDCFVPKSRLTFAASDHLPLVSAIECGNL